MEDQLEELENFGERVAAFRKTLTQREKKLILQKLDGDDDSIGFPVALLWIAKRRVDPKASYDKLLDLTDDELAQEILASIPFTQPQ